MIIDTSIPFGHQEYVNSCYTTIPTQPMHLDNNYADQPVQLILLSNEPKEVQNVSTTISTSDTFEQCTPTKERLQNDINKEFKSPKRKSNHPKRRCDVAANLMSLTKPPETPFLQSSNKVKESSISPLLGTDDFSQMVKAMFSNSNFTEKIADNINKVTYG